MIDRAKLIAVLEGGCPSCGSGVRHSRPDPHDNTTQLIDYVCDAKVGIGVNGAAYAREGCLADLNGMLHLLERAHTTKGTAA